jgi:predicted nicotinamide N-methyase
MPAGPQRRTPPQERHAFGLTILAPSHPEVRRLQHTAVRPSLHGQKVWPTSFVLLDYLQQRGVVPQARVLERGCGWGLVGIACAKTFQAQVTGLDADAAVFPSLQLHAQRNGVHIATRQGTFADLAPQELATFDLIVGADICFWEDLGDPLYRLVRLSVAVGVAEILVAAPGRPPFDDLCARCLQQGDAAVLAWATTMPVVESCRADRGRHARLWPWSRMTGWRRVRDVMAQAGIRGPHGSPKGLRHGFGVAAVTADVPLNLVQTWLGHAQLSTTAI